MVQSENQIFFKFLLIEGLYFHELDDEIKYRESLDYSELISIFYFISILKAIRVLYSDAHIENKNLYRLLNRIYFRY